MTRSINSLDEVSDRFDAIVLDQFGVLHDGTRPYPRSVESLNRLAGLGTRLAVLSNSGKRSEPNRARLTTMGFPPNLFEEVMTSGEALWRDVRDKIVAVDAIHVVCAKMDDAANWLKGLDVALVNEMADSDAVILMGLPGMEPEDCRDAASRDDRLKRLCDAIVDSGKPVYCSNPDRRSPRSCGQDAISPGLVAQRVAEAGCDVTFYGKPHLPVFRAVERSLGVPPDRLLMVGDSLEHDIRGASAAGWSANLVRAGLHRAEFARAENMLETLAALAKADRAPMPRYSMEMLG